MSVGEAISLHAKVARGVGRLNYETYLIQFGIVRWLRRGAARRILPATLALAALWAVYWLLYPAGLLLLALSWPLSLGGVAQRRP